MGVPQKQVSLKIDLFNRSLLLLHFSEKGDKREIARMASLGLPHAGNWLSVVPSPALGLHLRSSEIIPILKYRLGIQVYSKDALCPVCSSPSDRMGDHALGCPKTNDRIARHNTLRLGTSFTKRQQVQILAHRRRRDICFPAQLLDLVM